MLEAVADHVDIDIVDKEGGETPLHQAAFRGSPETVRFFLKKGANINFRNKFVTRLKCSTDRNI